MRRTAILFCMLALSACRDGVAPFALPLFSDSAGTGRLTYNVYGDHAPLWNRTADSIYYQAESYPSFLGTNGILLALPRKLGTASALLPIQVGVESAPWLAGPALSPDGKSLAFFEITKYGDRDFDRDSCPPFYSTPGYDTVATLSSLQQVVLRVRTVTSLGNDNAQLTVNIPGRTVDTSQHPGGALYVVSNIAYPFHRLFDAEDVPFFRPSWSPDGSKLVFSDGASLRLWTVGQSASTAIPNTGDGMLPAWSPDGAWIAFSAPVRGPTQSITCYGLVTGAKEPRAVVFYRTIYTDVDRENVELKLIRPDGTGLKSLGTGDAPAWTPDSKNLIAHRSGNLFSIAIDTGAASAIAHTNDAYEPVVSRDGHYLAFARRTALGDRDLFILRQGQYNLWHASL